MKKIGLTGGIGSGKTTIAKAFELLGVPVYYADARSKELSVSNPSVVDALKKLLGKEVYNADGSLNRSLMAEKLFSNEELLAQAEAVIHPAVFQDFRVWAEAQTHSGASYVIMEAALLVESKQTSLFDEVWVATAPHEQRIARTMQRDNASQQTVEARMANQTTDEARLDVAHRIFVTDNHQLLLPSILNIHNQLS